MLPRSKQYRKKTPELLALVLGFRAAGKTYREISEAVGVSVGTLNRWCNPTVDENLRRLRAAYQAQHPDKIQAYNRKSKGTLDSKMRSAITNISRRAEQGGYAPVAASKQELIAAYNLQEGRCLICGSTEHEAGRKLCVDHCHKTGAFRGFLCTRCNRVLGLFQDSIELMESAIAYLKKNP